MKKTAYSNFPLLILSIFLLLAGFLLSACRSNDLTREEASKAIADAPNYRDVQTIYISDGPEAPTSWLVRVTGDDDTPAQAAQRAIDSCTDVLPVFELTRKLGLIEPDFQVVEQSVPKKSMFADSWNWHVKTEFHLTEKGKKLFADYNLPENVNRFPVARRDAPTVTGMTRQGDDVMLVEYQYSYEPNELGKYLDPHSAEYKSLPERLKNHLAGGENENGNRYLNVLMPRMTSAQKGQAMFRRYDDGSWRLAQ